MTESGPAAVPRPRKPAPLWLARVYLVVSPLVLAGIVVMGVVLIVSGWHTRAQERPVAGWVTTTGTVIGVHQVADKDGYVYGPIVSFVDANGVSHRFTAPTSSDRPGIGDHATVSYDPVDPTRAHDLSDSGTSWAAPFVTGIIIVSFAGLMLLLVGGLLIHRRRRRRRGQPATVPASPRAFAAAMWIPRLSTIPIAAVVYIAVQSSSHRMLIAVIATGRYIVVALGFFTLLARVQRRRSPPARDTTP